MPVYNVYIIPCFTRKCNEINIAVAILKYVDDNGIIGMDKY